MEARWERRRDLPDEGGEVRRIGTRRERQLDIPRRASIVVGIETRGGGDDSPGDFKKK